VHQGNGRVILFGKCARDFESPRRQLLEVDRTQESFEHVRPQSIGLGPVVTKSSECAQKKGQRLPAFIRFDFAGNMPPRSRLASEVQATFA